MSVNMKLPIMVLGALALVASSGCSLFIALDEVTPETSSDASSPAKPDVNFVFEAALPDASVEASEGDSAIRMPLRDAEDAAEVETSRDASTPCVRADYPVWCPGTGSILGDGGTADADCWSPSTDCTTVRNCAGVLQACASGRIVDCAASKCVVPSIDASTETLPPIACDAGTVGCSGRCVNLQKDALNCGTCSKVCAPGQQCLQGQCCTLGGAGGKCSLPACGCATTEVCYPDTPETGLICLPTAGAQDGTRCSLDNMCAAGFGCFGGICRRYCSTDSDCPSVDGVRLCDGTTWNDGAPILGVSACRRVCDPVAPQSPRSPLLACPPAFGCLPDGLRGASSCLPQDGAGEAGATCAVASDCRPGHYCSGLLKCSKYCWSDADCPGTACLSLSPPFYAGIYEARFCLLPQP